MNSLDLIGEYFINIAAPLSYQTINHAQTSNPPKPTKSRMPIKTLFFPLIYLFMVFKCHKSFIAKLRAIFLVIIDVLVVVCTSLIWFLFPPSIGKGTKSERMILCCVLARMCGLFYMYYILSLSLVYFVKTKWFCFDLNESMMCAAHYIRIDIPKYKKSEFVDAEINSNWNKLTTATAMPLYASRKSKTFEENSIQYCCVRIRLFHKPFAKYVSWNVILRSSRNDNWKYIRVHF